MNITANVTVKGPMFTKRIDSVVKQAIIEETLKKVDERMGRKGVQGSGGKGLGVRRNIVSRKLTGLELTVDSTTIAPRTRGTAWQKKNVRIIKAMVPRVVRKTALRIASEL